MNADAAAGSASNIWQVTLQVAQGNTGAIPVTLSIGIGGTSYAVRDMNLTIWTK